MIALPPATPTPRLLTYLTEFESLTKSAAIIAAGVWTYWLFIRQRQRYPGAIISLHIDHRELGDGRNLLLVDVRLQNVGKTIIRRDKSDVRVGRVAPMKPARLAEVMSVHDPLDSLGAREIQWLRIGHRALKYNPAVEIEPGEFQSLRHEFAVKKVVATVKVTAHITNCDKRRVGRWYQSERLLTEIGWECAAYYDMTKDPLETQSGGVHDELARREEK